MRTTAATIDDYIAGFPADVQARLRKIRAAIRRAAPGVEETISYKIPAFRLNGALVYFAAFKDHISLYPAPRGDAAFRQELEAYKGGKGTVQFPLDEPIPLDLVRRIVAFRVKQNQEKAVGRAGKRAEKRR